MPTYESHKDSEISWIDEIPANWKIKKVKFINDIYNGDSLNENFKKKFESQNLEELPYISSKDINVDYSTIEYENGLRIPRGLSQYKVAPTSSSLICIEGGSAGRKIAYTEKNVCFVNKLACFKPKHDLFPKFGFYLLKSQPFQLQFQLSMSGLIGGVPISRLNNFSVYLPTLGVQKAIADFLDKKATLIDKAIKVKEKQIALLKEYKQIIIQNAVTKGLNPNAPMKDSGVEWIGQIPEHWKVKRLKFIGKATIGLTYEPNNLCDKGSGNLVLRASNLKDGKFVYGDKLNVYVNIKVSNELIVKKDDILICSRNGSRHLIGKCAIANKNDEGFTFGAFTTLFRSKINLYLVQIFNSEVFCFLSGLFLTSTINQLTIGNLNSISVPLPPYMEQKKIREHLETKSKRIDKTINFHQIQINKLKEYKASLIDSAVTGKIKAI